MVEVEQQRVAACAENQQVGLEQRALAQIERGQCVGVGAAPDFLRLGFGRERGQVVDGQRFARLQWAHPRLGLAVEGGEA